MEVNNDIQTESHVKELELKKKRKGKERKCAFQVCDMQAFTGILATLVSNVVDAVSRRLLKLKHSLLPFSDIPIR
jgi:hypothetical protein